MILVIGKYSKKIIKISGSIVMAVLLASCVSSVRDTYDLSVQTIDYQSQIKRNRTQILIAKPEAVKALDGQDIVIRDKTSIAYLKQAQWSDRLPDLIQARFIQAFENSNSFSGVGRPGDGLAINYQILSDIRSFDVNLVNGQKIATVEIGVKLMNDRNGNIIASKVFSAKSAVVGEFNKNYAKALNSAFENVTKDIVTWVASRL